MYLSSDNRMNGKVGVAAVTSSERKVVYDGTHLHKRSMRTNSRERHAKAAFMYAILVRTARVSLKQREF